jgi:arginyl-tRNA--protein-N-Asp/Glu arginylyltransferase
MSDLQKSIDRILDSYKSAVLARDVEAFMRLYDPDVRGSFGTYAVMWQIEQARCTSF